MDAWPRPPQPHPLAALDAAHAPVLRSNPLYTEEEEQEIIIIVQDSLEEAAGEVEAVPPRAPRRVPSTSSGYGSGGSGGGSQGRATPSPPAPRIPKTPEDYLERSHYPEPPGRPEGPAEAIVLRVTASEEDIECPLSSSLREEIRACLAPPADGVERVVAAALAGAGGAAAARARLQAALLALAPDAPAHALPYCGPGVRPGDVTMMPKTAEMSLLAASALFTLDAAKGEMLARRLARGRRRRRRCRAVVALAILAMLLAAVGAAELLMSRGTRMFGLLLR